MKKKIVFAVAGLFVVVAAAVPSLKVWADNKAASCCSESADCCPNSECCK